MNYIYITQNDQLLEIDRQITKLFNKSATIYNKGKYYNVISSFDIETTSTEYNGEKIAFMYIWALQLGELKIIGRMWEHFIHIINTLTTLNHNIIIWVHNLSFEFQFIRKFFQWSKVFALEERKVCYCKYKNITFRCSFILSGLSLEKTCTLYCPHISKKTGDLDYTLIRHSLTHITDTEINYLLYDIMCVCEYIKYELKQYHDITRIPLTKTGKVRQYCQSLCLPHKTNQFYRYKKIMSALTIEDEEYKYLEYAFAGGFTHGSFTKQGKIIDNVASFDLCSAYPAQMLLRQFPMSKGSYFENELPSHQYCYTVRVGYYNIIPSFFYEHIISKHKCLKLTNPVVDNGRIISADYLEICITDIDLKLIDMFYSYDKRIIYNGYYYRKDFLPEAFRNCVLNFYLDKTKLKGVEDQKEKYIIAKENLNSTYGMCVTSIIRPEYKYNDNEWETNFPNLSEELNKYNNSKKRFLFYPWGVWITAYTREAVLTLIHKLDKLYLYSDTDSIKAIDTETTRKVISIYNDNWIHRINNTADFFNVSRETFSPKTTTGKLKTIGLFEYEGTYNKFKFLRAKCYGYIKENQIDFTVAGVNSKAIKQKINTLEEFRDGLYIPNTITNKLCHTYIDDPICDIPIVDYNGIAYKVTELSSVHLSPIDFQINVDPDYITVINHIADRESSLM